MEIIEEKWINQSITINNIGYLPIKIKNITVDGYKCKVERFKISECREILLKPGDVFVINLKIKTNFGSVITNRKLEFNTDYQNYGLNVNIIISIELFEHKNFG